MLEDLHQWLELGPQLRVRLVEGRAVVLDRLEHEAGAEVRVVRDGQHVAVRRVDALGLQRVPQPLLERLVEVADGLRGNDVVAEDHVAVEIERARTARPLVADEAGERARVGAIVGGLGRVLHGSPGGEALRDAATLLVRAGGGSFRQRLVRAGPDVELDVGPVGVVPVVAAGARLVLGSLRGRAAVDEAEEFCVVAQRHEVERAVELHLTQRVSLGVVGLNTHALPTGEAVGIARRQSVALQVRIERKGGVHVGVAEVRAAQGVEVGAAA